MAWPESRRERIVSVAVWLLVAGWSTWLAARLLGLERGFPLVPLIAFTPWVALGSVIPIAAAALTRRPLAALLAGVVALGFAAVVLPRAFGGGVGDRSGTALEVMTANLKVGKADPNRFVALVEELDPDLLAVQELTPSIAAALERAELARLLPDSVLRAEPGSSGSGIYATADLRGLASPSLAPGGFSMAAATLQPAEFGGPLLEVTSVHTQPPTRGETTALWKQDLDSLPPAGPGEYRLLLGDFNATLDHAELRSVIDGGYNDAADAAGAGLAFTWPSGRILPPPVTIDHVLADERLGVGDVSVHEISGSDHRAVFAELYLPSALISD